MAANFTLAYETIDPPSAPAQREAWMKALQDGRVANRGQINAADSVYDKPAYAWCRRSFVQPQMMVEDRYFYDPVAGRYTVDRYLDDLEKRYGGIDSVLIWPVYPNVGIDNRGQHQLFADLPGGMEGIKGMVADFHRRGVRVLFPVMPWEGGTAGDPLPLPQAMARDFKAAGIDGVNGDTMDGFGREFLDAIRSAGVPLAFEPEAGMRSLDLLAWNPLSWGYWDSGVAAPTVDRYKWLEPRHLTHVCERWAKDHIAGLQAAFFNGDGFESWENIWGIWNGLTPRDGEAIRRVATIQRALGDRLSSADWQPHVATLQPDVYASEFPGAGDCAWVLVSRSDKETTGAQLTVNDVAGTAYYDLWHGQRLTPDIRDGKATLKFSMEPRGFGAVLATRSQSLPPEIASALAKMQELTARPLSDFSAEWKPLSQQIVEIPPTARAAQDPPGMTLIPAAQFHFQVSGVEIEGWGYPPQGDQTGVDVQYPWETVPTRTHEHDLSIPAFYIDTYPVTNAQFKAFLDATHYHPRDDHHFLADWRDGNFPRGWAQRPVTWVSLEDARAYASWAGKRLPHEWEWQYAAQGTDGRAYPWGHDDNPELHPVLDTGTFLTGANDVDAFPAGASPFGVMDLVGNIWQWTDEYRDEHTRAAIVRGDCYYRPQGSGWYFPRNPTLATHGKYLLMSPGKDRAGTLGFRCVKDK